MRCGFALVVRGGGLVFHAIERIVDVEAGKQVVTVTLVLVAFGRLGMHRVRVEQGIEIIFGDILVTVDIEVDRRGRRWRGL